VVSRKKMRGPAKNGCIGDKRSKSQWKNHSHDGAYSRGPQDAQDGERAQKKTKKVEEKQPNSRYQP